MLDTVVCLALWWPFATRALAREGPVPPLARTIAWLAVSATTAVALAGLQLLPLAELIRESARIAGGTATSPTPPALGAVLDRVPRSLADLLHNLDLTARGLHLPPAAWLLGVIGIALGRPPLRVPMLAVLVLTTALSTAARLVLQVAPRFALLRPNYCWVTLWYFGMAYMAGSGLEVVLAGAGVGGHERWPRARVVVAGVVLLASAFLLTPRSLLALVVSLAVLGVAMRKAGWRTPAVLVLVAVTVLSAWTWIPPSIAAPGLLHRYSRGEPPYPPEPPSPLGLGAAIEKACGTGQRVLAPWLAWTSAAVIEPVELLGGYPEPLVPSRIDRLLESLGVDPSPVFGTERLGRTPEGARILDMLNVGCVVTPAAVDLHRLDLVRAGMFAEDAIYRRHALPRAWLVHRVRTAGDGEAAWQAIHDPAFDAAHEAVLEGASETAGADGEARVEIERDEPGRIEMSVSTSAAGTLVIAQSFYPGWRARVDDAPVAVLRANYTAMALPVAAGEHRVILVYDPASLRAGKVLLALGLVVVTGLLLPGRRSHGAAR